MPIFSTISISSSATTRAIGNCPASKPQPTAEPELVASLPLSDDSLSPPVAARTGAALRRALVVEDNAIIAMDLEDTLRNCGLDEVHVAASVADALRAITDTPFDFAMLDIHLGSETSFAIADVLLENGVPYAFVTGYDDAMTCPEAHQHATRLAKPFREDMLRGLIDRILRPALE